MPGSVDRDRQVQAQRSGQRNHADVIRKRRHTKAHRLPEGAVPAARNRPRVAKGVMFNRGRTAVSCRRRPVFPREPARQLVPATACVSEELSIEPQTDRSTFRRTPPKLGLAGTELPRPGASLDLSRGGRSHLCHFAGKKSTTPALRLPRFISADSWPAPPFPDRLRQGRSRRRPPH